MIIIGEKINASHGRVKKALKDGEKDYLQQLCKEQEEAGANCIDVNVGMGEESANYEISMMVWLVKTLEEVSDKSFCIDSSRPEVIKAGVEACSKSAPMINSVNGNASRMDAIFPIAAKYKTPLVALPVNEHGIPETPEDRVKICRHMLERANEAGISADRIYLDPLVVPISTGERQGKIALDTLAAIKTMIKEARTILGLSNVSHGLPCRSLINRAFLSMAIGIGLDAVILNANDDKLMSHVRAAEAVSVKDRRCRRYTQAHNSGLLID